MLVLCLAAFGGQARGAVTLAPPAAYDLGTIPAVTGVVVGPDFAGEGVAWGQETRAGALEVVVAPPTGSPTVTHRLDAPAEPDTTVGFSGLPSVFAASESALSFVEGTSRVTKRGGDFLVIENSGVLRAGSLTGPYERIAGSSEPHSCPGSNQDPTSTDVEGHRIALGMTTFTCDGRDPAGEYTVALRDLRDGTQIVIRTAREFALVRRVRLAGRYLAWSHQAIGGVPDEVVVWDLDQNRVAYRVTATGLGVRFLEDFALQPDGKIALTYAPRGLSTPARRLAWFAPGDLRAHLVSRSAISVVEMAGDRIVYDSLLDARGSRQLVVAELTGVTRRLARFPVLRRGRVGDIAFDGTRVAWATRRGDATRDEDRPAPARVYLATLR